MKQRVRLYTLAGCGHALEAISLRGRAAKHRALASAERHDASAALSHLSIAHELELRADVARLRAEEERIWVEL